MNLSQTQSVQAIAGVLKDETPRLDPVPHQRVAQMVGEGILGAAICLVGLGLIAAALYTVVIAKKVDLLALALVAGGVGVFFAGAILISKKLVASLMNVATFAKAIRAAIKGQPEPPAA